MFALVGPQLGCATIRYLFQAGKGQWALSNSARPVVEVIKDEKTSPELRKLLGSVEGVKKFGEEFGLRPTKNYTEFVKLDRKAVVWVVSACQPLKFDPKTWWFPVVGSFTYLGWFDRHDAEDFAKELRAEGLDVDVRGARAFSTLGWFRDPVLSTMILTSPTGLPDESAIGELANVVLHESVHATLYQKDQSYFNESVASFAADTLTSDYLEKTLGKGAPEIGAYRRGEEEGKNRERIFHEAYVALEKLYASSLSDTEKLSEKSKIFTDLKRKSELRREINNATLIQYKTYGTGQEEFQELFNQCGRDWKNFWKALNTLKAGSFSRAQQEDLAPVLGPLITAKCR